MSARPNMARAMKNTMVTPVKAAKAATGVTHKSFFGETRSLGNVVFMEIFFD
jgi:hypothetical protein